ncbi:MAG: phosphoadenosine phosphosulfate reductase family protein [Rhodocyclales bacterium]|nr:phosphoadenosine phosphosulfate reductase family protein [Rhodocyclales bacterium]
MQQLIDIRRETAEELALQAMVPLLERGHPLVVLFSAGKDSSVLANLAATAAARVVATGRRTLVARREIDKYRRFCEGRGVDVAVRVAQPAFWDSFAVRVLGGRALPTFPDTRRDCTTDWKRLANTRELAALWRELAQQNWREPVLMTGVRRDESVARALSIASRGEQALDTWTDADGRLRLSPLLNWPADDVWTYLGLCNAGVVDAYSDFEETMQVYQAAGGSGVSVRRTHLANSADPEPVLLRWASSDAAAVRRSGWRVGSAAGPVRP